MRLSLPSPVTLAITLALFILAPFFRKWVDLVFWPKLADWWAVRSRRQTVKRIQKLEKQLSEVAPLRVLTDFEEMVLASVSGLVTLILSIGTLGYFLETSELWRLADYRVADSPVVSATIILLIVDLAGVGMVLGLQNFRKARSSEYRQALQEDIDRLQKRLM
jgi:hypothetical protein